ncbi:hypothetical protein O3V59_02390 [Brevibacillus thermoruber]|jgi:hypothetical protein|uniref:Uncharacterized protein n=1 Tax=Brevibacillus thermoruber TaxID=33942 RepID=A0A9X3Z232_9BACL|nr:MULTISPECIES: hypothetical protein [Brevibacillus]MDA5107195.1 hypothetical protein [Brevibacillus thermoruber]UYZ11532.1 hypothetical protein A6764_11685 [Brevibacillus sp. WF146]
MKQIVYRGVEYKEALRVVAAQRYEREERRRFVNGASAKAVFGSGVYLVSNPKIAAQYAICHAETTWDQAAVLAQELELDGLAALDERYGENELRADALRWRHTPEQLTRLSAAKRHEEWLEWTGDEIRAYLLDRGFAGIRYRISRELTYFVCYKPHEQIGRISLLTVFDIPE